MKKRRDKVYASAGMKHGGKVKTYKHGGKVTCRGMGAATRGGRFRKDG